jgi:two-component system KDP operon response regulator KdpE
MNPTSLVTNRVQNQAPCHTIQRAGTNPAHDQTGTFDDGCLRVDLQSRTVTLFGRDLGLTSAERRCVLHLASRRGQVVPYRELLVHVWGPAYENETFLLQAYMGNLRHKVERDPFHPLYILERQREGYYFCTLRHQPSPPPDAQKSRQPYSTSSASGLCAAS